MGDSFLFHVIDDLKKWWVFLAMSIICFSGYANSFEVSGMKFDYSVSSSNSELPKVTNCVLAEVTNKSIQTLIIPDTISYNGNKYVVYYLSNAALSGCDALEEVTVPGSVISLAATFRNLPSLRKITFNYGPTDLKVSSDPFKGSPIESLFLDRSMEYVNNWSSCTTFENKTSLKEINIGSKVEKIRVLNFNGCTGLSELVIPKNVRQFSCNFSGCTNLTKLILEDGESEENEIWLAATDWLKDCPLEEVYIGRKIMTESYFINKPTLSSVRFSDALTSIPRFRGCTGLQSVDLPNSLISLGSLAFSDCSGLTEIILPAGLTSIGREAFRNCTSLTKIRIPDSVTLTDVMAFEGCTNLSSVTLSSSMESIEYSVFRLCSSLKEISFPSSIKSIGGMAFYGTGIEQLTIPSSIENIGMGAFINCQNLKEVHIDDSETALSISSDSFTDYFMDSSIEKVFIGRDFTPANAAPFNERKKENNTLTSVTFGYLVGCSV